MEAYLASGGDGCPTTADLTAASVLNATARSVDAWSHDFSIECEGDRITVTSAGPDGQLGTEDDVR